jgi:hypothetical protein
VSAALAARPAELPLCEGGVNVFHSLRFGSLPGEEACSPRLAEEEAGAIEVRVPFSFSPA